MSEVDQKYYVVAIMAAILARQAPPARPDVIPIGPRSPQEIAEEAWTLFDAVEEGWVNRLPL